MKVYLQPFTVIKRRTVYYLGRGDRSGFKCLLKASNNGNRKIYYLIARRVRLSVSTTGIKDSGSPTITMIHYSVPARHISEGAAPCPYRLAPCPNSLAPRPIYIAPCPNRQQKYLEILFLCFQKADELYNAYIIDLCSCFHRSATKLCPDLVSFACWIVPEFWAFAL